MPNNSFSNNSGFALLLSIIIASVLLALGLTMLTITTKQLALSSVARESEIAFHAAAAGMECLRFHRRDQAAAFEAPLGSTPTAPVLECFGNGGGFNGNPDPYDTAGNDYINLFEYDMSWGSSPTERCSKVDIYVMVPVDGDYPYDFSAVSKTVGNKTCPLGSKCSVIISEGYNKSCGDVDNGLATVQRELTAEGS